MPALLAFLLLCHVVCGRMSSREGVQVVISDLLTSETSTATRSTVSFEGCEVSLLAAGQSNPLHKDPVLLLHGAAFSAQTWLEIGTLDALSKAGRYAVAVDLPGYGSTKRCSIENRGAWLLGLIRKLELARPVLVSPSMSGSYSLDAVMRSPSLFSGFVPVAPVGCQSLSIDELKLLILPSLLVWGSEDKTRMGALCPSILSNIPNSRTLEIPKAGHPAYMFNKTLWNVELLEFVRDINHGTATAHHVHL
jgi:abhydrolase domain-containing protein 14